jgi:hypothetical protein
VNRSDVIITEMGVSNAAKNVIPLKFLRKIKNKKCYPLVGTYGRSRCVTKENIDLDHDMVLTDRRVIVRFVAERRGFSISTVEKILHEELKLKKISARWVRNMSTCQTCHR